MPTILTTRSPRTVQGNHKCNRYISSRSIHKCTLYQCTNCVEFHKLFSFYLYHFSYSKPLQSLILVVINKSYVKTWNIFTIFRQAENINVSWKTWKSTILSGGRIFSLELKRTIYFWYYFIKWKTYNYCKTLESTRKSFFVKLLNNKIISNKTKQTEV